MMKNVKKWIKNRISIIGFAMLVAYFVGYHTITEEPELSLTLFIAVSVVLTIYGAHIIPLSYTYVYNLLLKLFNKRKLNILDKLLSYMNIHLVIGISVIYFIPIYFSLSWDLSKWMIFNNYYEHFILPFLGYQVFLIVCLSLVLVITIIQLYSSWKQGILISLVIVLSPLIFLAFSFFGLLMICTFLAPLGYEIIGVTLKYLEVIP